MTQLLVNVIRIKIKISIKLSEGGRERDREREIGVLVRKKEGIVLQLLGPLYVSHLGDGYMWQQRHEMGPIKNTRVFFTIY